MAQYNNNEKLLITICSEFTSDTINVPQGVTVTEYVSNYYLNAGRFVWRYLDSRHMTGCRIQSQLF